MSLEISSQLDICAYDAYLIRCAEQYRAPLFTPIHRLAKNLTSLLDQAIVEGEVRIRRRDGTVFVVRLERSSQSPLDVPVVDLGISTREIVDYIAEGRRYVEES